MQHSTSVRLHIRKAKHAPNIIFSVLFKPLCTLDLKSGDAAKWSNCAQIDALCKRNKAWLVQNVHNSVSCTGVSMKYIQGGSSCTIVSTFVHHLSMAERKEKHPKYDIFSVLSAPVCRARPNKIRMSVSQLHPKLRSMQKKWRFLDKPVQLIQNVHRFASCCIGQDLLHTSAHAARKRQTWWKARSRRSLRLSAQRTSNQDVLLRGPTVPKVTNNEVSMNN